MKIKHWWDSSLQIHSPMYRIQLNLVTWETCFNKHCTVCLWICATCLPSVCWYFSCSICKQLCLPECTMKVGMLHIEHHRPINLVWHKFAQWKDVLHWAIVHKPLFVEKQTKGETVCQSFYKRLSHFLKMWDNE